MQKYGKDSFTIEILEVVEPSEANQKERFWIQKLRPEYNMTEGGEGGDTSKSPNFINSIKLMHENRDSSSYATYGMLGKKMPEEGRKKISKANSFPVVCSGVYFDSIKDAENYFPGISIRKRLDSTKYPDFYRIKEKIKRYRK